MERALLLGILTVAVFAFQPLKERFADGTKAAVAVTALAGITGSPSGGMDTLPHNGAVITLLAVTGLTHREAYRDVFAITLVKTAAVAAAIGVFYLTGLY